MLPGSIRAEKLNETAYHGAGCAGIMMSFWLVHKSGTSDIDVQPGLAVDEPFEEFGGRDCTAPSPIAHVLDIGHIATYLLIEESMHG